MTTASPEPIPEHVLDALEVVRASGATNMFARDAVLALCSENEDFDAFMWLYDNPNRYVEALKAMGARRRAP